MIVPPVAAEMFWDVLAIVPATIMGIDADLLPSAALVAVMLTVKGVGKVVGAS